MKKRKFRERMIAWLLAITMIIGGCVMPDHRLVSYAAQTEERYTGGADQGNAGDSSAVNGYAADVHAKTTAAADYNSNNQYFGNLSGRNSAVKCRRDG